MSRVGRRPAPAFCTRRVHHGDDDDALCRTSSHSRRNELHYMLDEGRALGSCYSIHHHLCTARRRHEWSAAYLGDIKGFIPHKTMHCTSKGQGSKCHKLPAGSELNLYPKMKSLVRHWEWRSASEERFKPYQRQRPTNRNKPWKWPINLFCLRTDCSLKVLSRGPKRNCKYSCSLYAIARPSVVCLSSVCRLSVVCRL